MYGTFTTGNIPLESVRWKCTTIIQTVLTPVCISGLTSVCP
jgi:hypothetical protein